MNDAVKTDLAEYYARRAAEYETIYARPERQADLAALRERVRELLQGQRVLEIACGTGYWTAQIADVADAVLATDISPEVIEVARAKNLPADKVRFARRRTHRPARSAPCRPAGFSPGRPRSLRG